MKSKIIMHSILCVLLTGMHSITAMNKDTQNKEIVSLSRSSSTQTSPLTSPRSSQSSSPTTTPLLSARNSHEDLKKLIKTNSTSNLVKRSSTRDLLKTQLIFFKHSDDDEQWYEIKSNGIFNKDNMLSYDKRKEHKNHFKAEFIIQDNDTVSLKATHVITEQYGCKKINSQEQFSLPTPLTREQCMDFINSEKMIFAVDKNKNSYCINWNQDSINDDNEYSSIKEYSTDSDSDDINSEKCIADVYDKDNNNYQVWLVDAYDTLYIEIDKINEKDNSLFSSDELPQNENVYLDLLRIDNNQTIAVDKDANIYIRAGDNYILQSNPTSDTIITIKPLELSKQKDKPENTTPKSTIITPNNQSTQTNFTPTSKLNSNNNDDDDLHFDRYTLIGSVALVGMILAVLYKYNKLPNITELINKLTQRVRNIAFQ
jgi:hypothetical protein